MDITVKLTIGDTVTLEKSNAVQEFEEVTSFAGSHDFSSGKEDIDAGVQCEVLYYAYVQPCIVLGLSGVGSNKVKVSVDSSRDCRVVVALGDNSGYEEPVVDEFISTEENSSREFSLVS